MSLGLGSVIVSVVEVAPWLGTVSRHKGAIFGFAGGLLALSYWFAIVRPRRMNCAPGEICHVDSPVMRVNRLLFWTSAVIYATAATVTFVALWWVRMQS